MSSLIMYSCNNKKNKFLLRSDSPQGSRVGFASQLCLLVDALDMSLTAQFMEDFVSGLE